jgi:hypothetical protein
VLATTLNDIEVGYRHYRCRGCGKGQSPALHELGIRSRMSPLLEEFAVFLGADRPFVRAMELLRKLVGGSRISASTIMRRTESAGEEVLTLERQKSLTGSWGLTREDTLVASADGCMVNTRQAGWKEVKTGVVQTLNGERRRYVAHLGGPEKLGKHIRQELMSLGAGRAGRHVAVGDGSPWIWRLFHDKYPDAEQVLDYYHAAEQIHTCGNTLYKEGTPGARRWSDRIKGVLWEKGPGPVLQRLVPARFPRGRKRKAVRSLLRYIQKNRLRMNYPSLRKQGLPQGSGIVESACKDFVLARLRLSGCRWNQRAAEDVLAIRSVGMSGLWEPFTARRYGLQVPSN